MNIAFSIILNDENGCPPNELKFFRLPPPNISSPYNLQFLITAGSPCLHNAKLFINYPKEGESFKRETFQALEFHGPSYEDCYVSIAIKQAGVFEFYLEYELADFTITQSRVRGRFVVDPCLYLKEPYILPTTPGNSEGECERNKLLPLDGITCLTVIPKWLPKLSQWNLHFGSIQKTCYNMVHFGPLQERGVSDSPYSIFDQLSFSDDLFDTPDLSCSEKNSIMKEKISEIVTENRILSITDVVWNHTANNSAWLLQHPEAGYNLVNAPHLKPAFALDEALLEFSDKLHTEYGLCSVISTEEELSSIMNAFQTHVMPPLRLYEFFVVDVKSELDKYREVYLATSSVSSEKLPEEIESARFAHEQAFCFKKHAVYRTKGWGRFSLCVDFSKANALLHAFCGLQLGPPNNQTLGALLDKFEKILNDINLPIYEEYDADIKTIYLNISRRASFLRLAGHGPKLGRISRKTPLVDAYFTRLNVSDMALDKQDPDLSRLACNGWIWNADPLVDFASENSKAYFRREVIAWGDCVKLRYGKCPADSPWLWEHMRSYTTLLADIFAGFRIDNCHSTPMHVASYLLDEARRVNPNLYVIAELFTGSEEKDLKFVGELGINSLIREAMQAWDSFELSRQVHRQGGLPLGAISLTSNYVPPSILGQQTVFNEKPVTLNENIQVSIRGSSRPHALFMDCTHDNETPNQKRTPEDALSNAAIVALSCCASGSVRGYDQLVPTLLDLVNEQRLYLPYKHGDGIAPVKAILNHLHEKLARDNYSEVHVHHENNYISIHRVHPITHDGYLLIARTAFHHNDDPNAPTHSPIVLPSTSANLVLSATLRVSNLDRSNSSINMPEHPPYIEANKYDIYGSKSDYLDPISPISPASLFHSFSIDNLHTSNKSLDNMFIEGLKSELTFSTSLTTLCHQDFSAESKTTSIYCDPRRFSPGSIVIFRTTMLNPSASLPREGELSICVNGDCSSNNMSSTEYLWGSLFEQGFQDRSTLATKWMLQLGNEAELGVDFCANSANLELHKCLADADAQSLNILLYRVPEEERDLLGPGCGVYTVPNYGPLAYCGVVGFLSLMSPISRTNWLDHPLCENLRQGNWALDYLMNRLELHVKLGLAASLTELVSWLKDKIETIKRLPRSYIPKYFSLIVHAVFSVAMKRLDQVFQVVNLDSAKVSSFNNLDRALALGSIQMNGKVNSARLFSKFYPSENDAVTPLALAAGLTHFSTGHMRCWGRDVFIALRGLFLMTGQFEQARNHLIAFGSTMLHGLIPNLLDSGHRPRFNARDAVWWWLYAVQEYCRMSDEGVSFLKTSVWRRFSNDVYVEEDSDDAFKTKSTIAELVFEALAKHASGISFREWNAGQNLDHAMKSEGFNIAIHCDIVREDVEEVSGVTMVKKVARGTGFVKGGNKWNCGTWMDKMGDSEKAKNCGIPATPRDGSPIEIIGLLKATLRWVVELADKHSDVFKYTGVQVNANMFLSFKDWNDMVQESFEAQFYVPLDPEDDAKFNITEPQLVNRRGIYRDVVNTTHPFASYQLRPNVSIALVVAPELFTPDRAMKCLDIMHEVLQGPLGIKTLDPSDWAFRGVYDNGNDTTDYNVAHGFNYHQGPEWVWVQGFFFRAYLHFGQICYGLEATLAKVTSWLRPHKRIFHQSLQFPYAGLPELTQAGGEYCPGSCDTQAWSMACFKELLHDMRTFIEKK